MKYTVIRAHGRYSVGDTREARPAEVAHLVGKCLVEAEGGKASAKVDNKAAPELENKGGK